MAFSIKNVKPLHLYVVFVVLILLARFFEETLPPVYYLLVLFGWLAFFMAVRNFFKPKPSNTPPKKAPIKKTK